MPLPRREGLGLLDHRAADVEDMFSAEDVEVTVMVDLLRLELVFVNQFYIFALRER